jgi:hypothetical protein
MNGDAPTPVPIFATPFAALPLTLSAGLNGTLEALLAARATEQHRDPEAPRDPLCYRSREDLFDWQDAGIAELRRAMLLGLCATVRAITLGTAAEFDRLSVEARARFAIVRPHGSLTVTTLPLASWGAIYCVAAPAQPVRALSGVLRLYEPRLGTMFMDASNWQLRPPFANGHQIWQPVAGQMAAFPAWVAHEIAVNHGERDLVLVVARARFAHPGQEAAPPW